MYGNIDPDINLEKLRASLLTHEGKRLKPYMDSVGKLTIGIGRNLTDRGISDAECAFLLDNDIQLAISEAKSLDCWPMVRDDDVRSRALVEMVFNLGKPRLLGFIKFLAAVRRKDWTDAKQQMLESRWADQIGQRAVILAQMIETGI